jgi:hypothetical protein
MYRTAILSVVLFGCETWSLIIREEHSLRMFENRVLRKIFWPKKDEVTGDWRRLHIEEVYDLYSSPKSFSYQFNNNEMGGTCGTCRRQERYIQGFGGET